MSNNREVLEKLGLQEMLTSPDFADFTRWFCGLTEENHLTEEEVVRINELKSAGTFIDDVDILNQRIDELVGNTFTDDGVIDELQEKCDDLKDTKEALENILAVAAGTELKMDEELSRLNSEIQESQMNIELLTQNCQEDAQMLEDLCMRNIENRSEFLSSFSSGLSPPMRWCRLDYENYFVDSNNAALSMKLLFEKTLKLKDDSNFVDEDYEHKKRLYELQTVETTFTRTATALYEAESDLKRIDFIIDQLARPFQPMSCSLMSEQIERLTWQNEEFEENLENLESMIKEKIALLGFQEAKFCEMENNKEKLGAAEKRLELLKQCSDRISNHLLLSELLWLWMNTEKEAVENILENVATAHYEQEIEQCARNSENLAKMSSNSLVDHVEEEFSEQVAEIIADGIVADDIITDATITNELANPVAKYAEAVHHFDMQLRDVTSNSYQIKIVDLIKDFNGISAHLNAFIGNGPANKPNIWNLPILAESEIYRPKFERVFDLSRTMRHNFMEKYHRPFTNDELWRRRQLLWIWFLTDEAAFLEAFQKTVGDIRKNGHPGNLSIVGGLRRQQ